MCFSRLRPLIAFSDAATADVAGGGVRSWAIDGACKQSPSPVTNRKRRRRALKIISPVIISSPDSPSVTLILRRAEQDLSCFRIVLSGRRSLDVCEHLQRALHGRARVDSVEPLLDLVKLRPVDSVSLARAKPRKDRDISDGILRAGKVQRLR